MKSKGFVAVAAAATLLMLSQPARSALLFSDNFDANTAGLNAVPTGWSIANNGTVDVIGVGTAHDFIPGNGLYVDLDGSTSSAGLLTQSFGTLGAGSYTATFDLAGSHRGTAETVTVDFGGVVQSYTLQAGDGWTSFSISVNSLGGPLSLSFLNSGGDNVGALLDRVTVSMTSAVPEPASVPLMLAGLLTLGWSRRRALRR